MDINYSRYVPENKETLLEIFKSNCPTYFAIEDAASLIDFLDHFADVNFNVVRLDGIIVGCGGHYVRHDKNIIGIAWVMFRRYALGRNAFLKLSQDFFLHLLAAIKKEKLDYEIVINTTQLMERTFTGFGFYTTQIIKDGFGNNLDHCEMKRRV